MSEFYLFRVGLGFARVTRWKEADATILNSLNSLFEERTIF